MRASRSLVLSVGLVAVAACVGIYLYQLHRLQVDVDNAPKIDPAILAAARQRAAARPANAAYRHAPRYTLSDCPPWPMAVAVSPDGKLGAASFAHGMLLLWDLPTGENLHYIERRSWRQFASLRFSDDHARLLSCGQSSQVRVWDTASGQITALLGVPAQSGLFLDAGRKLLLPLRRSGFTWWDITDERLIATPYHPGQYDTADTFNSSNVALSPDGSIVACSLQPGTITLMPLAHPSQSAELTMPAGGQTRTITHLAWMPDGRSLLVADGGLSRISLDGDVIWTHGPAAGSALAGRGYKWVEPAPGGAYLFAVEDALAIYDAKTGLSRGGYASAGEYGAALTPDGSVLATLAGYDHSKIEVWDAAALIDGVQADAERARALRAAATRAASDAPSGAAR